MSIIYLKRFPIGYGRQTGYRNLIEIDEWPEHHHKTSAKLTFDFIVECTSSLSHVRFVRSGFFPPYLWGNNHLCAYRTL